MIRPVSVFRTQPIQAMKRTLVQKAALAVPAVAAPIVAYQTSKKVKRTTALVKEASDHMSAKTVTNHRAQSIKKLEDCGIKVNSSNENKYLDANGNLSYDGKLAIKKAQKNPSFKSKQELEEAADNGLEVSQNEQVAISDPEFTDVSIEDVDVSLPEELQEIADAPTIDLIDSEAGELISDLADGIEDGDDISEVFEKLLGQIS